ncbi:hypothetical protein HDZ31DRAFT_40157 [Schizophyllum fasciatum]
MHAKYESVYEDIYCTLCDQVFHSMLLFRQHVEQSQKHPRCETCDRRFVNNLMLRQHYAISKKHNFCTICEKQFDTPSGLRWHTNNTRCYRKRNGYGAKLIASCNARNIDRSQPNWEDKQAQLEDEQMAGQEEDVPLPANASSLSQAKLEIATMVLQRKYKKQEKVPILKQRCPICLSTPKTAVTTHCGHLFCGPCIEHVVGDTGSCPTCRKPCFKVQLRKVDLRVF